VTGFRKLNTACFVYAGESQPSEMWLGYAQTALGAASCTIGAALNGIEPKADVYVAQMTQLKPPIERWHGRGAKVFVWIDDALFLMPKLLPASFAWKNVWPDVCRWLKDVDGIISPSAVLAQDMQLINNRAFHVPNYHNFPVIKTDVKYPYQSCYAPRFGWGGSFYHWQSWRDTGLYKCLPDDSVITIIDNEPVAEMIRKYSRCTVEFKPYMNHAAYLREMATWDFALLPVQGEYDKRRSWIKALEANYVGTTWLAVGDAARFVYDEAFGGRVLDDAVELLDDSILDYPQQYNGCWAEGQRITKHVEEWQGVLYG
jgi:hypothetical protein